MYKSAQHEVMVHALQVILSAATRPPYQRVMGPGAQRASKRLFGKHLMNLVIPNTARETRQQRRYSSRMGEQADRAKVSKALIAKLKSGTPRPGFTYRSARRGRD